MMAHILSEDRIDYLRRPLVARFGLLGGMLVACAVASEAEGQGSRRADGDGIAGGAPRVEERIVIDRIWPAVPVGYCLLTHGNRQYVAYYNADRRMVVAQRTLGEDTFEKFVLPSESDKPPRESSQTSTVQGWDSHNFITMAVDSAGHIHLSGNMHVDPLLYFRTETAGDITSMKQIKSMVGKNENRCTYPKFMQGPGGELLFHYRDGKSGSGVEIYNAYDVKTGAWRRFLDQPLVSGLGKENAYQMGPTLGPDGKYHLGWVWRQSSDCATNHDISYARSADLINWETAMGKPLKLPITPQNKETIVDPVPIRAGLINMGNSMGFDSDKRVIVTYHKYDKDGNNQAYAARIEDGNWVIRQLTDWKYRWHFSGGGSVPAHIRIGGAKPHGQGKLAVPYNHATFGEGLLILDEKTLAPMGTEPKPLTLPAELTTVTTDLPDMQVNWRHDLGESPDASRYMLRWETLGPNRDLPRKPPFPESGELILYRLKDR